MYGVRWYEGEPTVPKRTISARCIWLSLDWLNLNPKAVLMVTMTVRVGCEGMTGYTSRSVLAGHNRLSRCYSR
jgi:hypothetical protein